MKAKGYNTILQTETQKQVVITTIFCSEVKILAN